jgi:hypothetical protein
MQRLPELERLQKTYVPTLEKATSSSDLIQKSTKRGSISQVSGDKVPLWYQFQLIHSTRPRKGKIHPARVLVALSHLFSFCLVRSSSWPCRSQFSSLKCWDSRRRLSISHNCSWEHIKSCLFRKHIIGGVTLLRKAMTEAGRDSSFMLPLCTEHYIGYHRIKRSVLCDLLFCFCILADWGLELRTSHLWGRCPTTWTTPSDLASINLTQFFLSFNSMPIWITATFLR